MKKKLLIALFLIGLIHFNFAQELQTIFPASPEASTLGQYGDIPVNMSRGITNFSVPIYSINDGTFSLPISLSYYNNGLIRDNIPGCLGLGWSLNAGGMVTRQVRGRPDESPLGYIGENMTGLNWVVRYHNNQLSTDEKRILNQNSITNLWDTQPDKFIVNVGNLNATFYFDENKNPVIKPYKPYKIEFVNQQDFLAGIRITDDKGIVYLFQDEEYSERKAPFNGIGDAVASFGEYVSGWKLTQINLPSNKTINFTYSDYTYTQKITSQSETVNPPQINGSVVLSHANYEIRSKLLAEIQFSSGQILFNNISLPTVESNQYLSRLNFIKIKNLKNTVVKKFDFTFDDNNKTRKLLQRIIIDDNPTNEYKFEYNGVPSDNIPFYKQDFWGYVNNNPTSRLVKVNDLYNIRKPDFNKAIKGVLSKITYPTKGTTEIIYEPNTYDPGPDGDRLDDYYYGSGECALLSQSLNTSVIISSATTNSDSDIKTFTVDSDVYMKLQLKVIKNTSIGNVYAGLRRLNTPTASKINCKLSSIGPCSDCTDAVISFSGGFTNQPLEEVFYSSKQLKLVPGTYELYSIAQGFNFTPCGSQSPPGPFIDNCESLTATASIYFSDGTTHSIIRSRETGGVRVLQVISCPDGNLPNCITKEYNYESSNGISNGHMFRKRNLFKRSYETVNKYILGGHIYIDVEENNSYSSSSNVPLGSYSGSHLIYKKVIEKTIASNGQENGSKITDYNYVEIPDPISPFIVTDNKEYQNGKIKKESLLNSQEIINQTINTINTIYEFSHDLGLNQRVIGFKTEKIRYDIGLPFGADLYQIAISNFSNNYDVDRVEQIKSTSFFGINPIIVDNYFQYTSPQGHLKQEKIIDSNDEFQIKKYKYPYTDTPNVINTEMISKNMIKVPTKTEVFKNGNILSTQYQKYKNWGSNIIFQEFIQTAKGEVTANNPLEDRITYHNYDNYGNPTELSKTSGIHITYIWGYNHTQPIAKIINATYAEVETILGAGFVINEYFTGLQEDNLRNGLPNAQVTTIDYYPLIGVSRVTDQNGDKQTYHYDDFNRLKFVKDAQNNILSKNEYHYRSQN